MEETNDFNAFWEKYPRKVGKTAAFKKWKTIKNINLTIILTAIENQKKTDQWKKDGGIYIPHPATWLNQGRWEDEVIIPKKKTAFVL